MLPKTNDRCIITIEICRKSNGIQCGFAGAFVDSDIANFSAICVYEKVGFKKIKKDKGLTMMVKSSEW